VCGGAARAVEHLPPTQAHRASARDRDREVAIEVAVALAGGVVEEPPVELDAQAIRPIDDVTTDPPLPV
jgi:hypothetical protein